MYCHYRVNCMQVYFIKCSYYHKDIYLLKIDKKTFRSLREEVRNKKFESSFFICAFFSSSLLLR